MIPFFPVTRFHFGVEVFVILWSACCMSANSDLGDLIDIFFRKRRPYTCKCDVSSAAVQETLFCELLPLMWYVDRASDLLKEFKQGALTSWHGKVVARW